MAQGQHVGRNSFDRAPRRLQRSAGGHSFYVFMRFVACGTGAYLAVGARAAKRSFWTWVMGAVTVLFNLLVPVHMRRHDWQRFDLLGAFVFAIYLGIASRPTKRVL